MAVVAIRKRAESPAEVAASAKAVPANQKAIDALPFDSGTWRVEGVTGLFVRCRAQTKSFYIQRRVQGTLVKETLGELPMKRAREKAMKVWSALKVKPASGKAVTLEGAVERYIEEKALAPKTVKNYRYNLERYLKDWSGRGLDERWQRSRGLSLSPKATQKGSRGRNHQSGGAAGIGGLPLATED